MLVVGEPELLAGIRGRRLVAPRAGAEGEAVAVPAHAAFGREDGPAHLSEALHEEGCHRLDDVVLRLEPGDVQRAGFGALAFDAGQRPEAHEGGHLVQVAPHRAGHLLGLHAVGVERVVAQVRLVLQPPQQAIQQAEAVPVAVQQGALAQGAVEGRHADGGGRLRRGSVRALHIVIASQRREQVGIARGDMPAHPRRLDALHEQKPGRAPEAVDIGLFGERDALRRPVVHDV